MITSADLDGLDSIETPHRIHHIGGGRLWEDGPWTWICSCRGGCRGRSTWDVGVVYSRWLKHAIGPYRLRDFIRVNDTLIYKPDA